MHIILSAHPARKTALGYQVSFSLVGDNPSRTVEAANIREVREHFEAFKAEVEATGKPYRVSVMQHPRDHSRKFPGFNKLEDYMTKATETATEEEVRATR